MSNIEVKINRKTREVKPNKIFIGLDGENLQENVIFSFEDEFVQGQARLDIEFRDGTKGQITELNQVGETYVLPIKSEITKYNGCIAQLVIDEGTDENAIPIFKSLYVGLIVAESINASIPIPEGYTEWIDSANAKLNLIDEKLENIDESITETNNLDLDVSKSGKVATVTLTKKDASEKVVTLKDGTNLMFNWDGTKLGIKTDEDAEYTYVDLQGIQGPIGPKGEAFTIKKTYSSVEAMNADFNNMQLGDYVMIASTVEVEDNAKLYTRGEEQWIFISDFSGATGIRGETGLTPNIQIGTVTSGETPNVTRTGTNENPILNFTLVKGDKGDTGSQGIQGETGNGISSITKTSSEGLVDTYTITYTDGTTSTFNITNGEDGEVTQTQFDALEERVDDLERNQLYGNEEGTNIYIDDAHDTRVNNFELEKESSQYTTTGKNLLPNNLTSQTINGITATVNEDGSIHFTGTPTSATTFYLATNQSDLENNTRYALSSNCDFPRSVVFRLSDQNDTSKFYNISYSDSPLLFTYDGRFSSGKFQAFIWFASGSVGTAVDFTVYPQLELGTATNYEEYTGTQPSPSREFPQSVVTVKGYEKDGNNYIAVTITDDNNTEKEVELPLNGNEIAGKGDYLDEYIVDKTGHCWLNKVTGKYELDGNSKKFEYKHPTITSETKGFYRVSLPNKNTNFPNGSLDVAYSDYFSLVSGTANNAFNNNDSGMWWQQTGETVYFILNKTSLEDANDWLSTHNMKVIYPLETPQLIDLNTTIDLKLFKNINNISNSENANMRIRYVQSIDILRNEITELDGRITALEEANNG